MHNTLKNKVTSCCKVCFTEEHVIHLAQDKMYKKDKIFELVKVGNNTKH